MRLLQFGLFAFLLLLGHSAFADQANVFVYHRFDDSRYPSTNISLQDFRAHLDLLHQQEFAVLTLGQVVDRLRKGVSLPQRCAVITVDDAYRSFLTDGWPLLKLYGYPATLFVTTNTVGGGDYLDWQELGRLQDEGVEIGNHSAGHAYLLDRMDSESAADWAAWILADIRRSQQAFESHLGLSPNLFAYPYGEFTPELVDLIKSAGFTAAFGQQSGVITAGQDFFALPRFPVGGVYSSLSGFRSKLFMKRLPVNVIAPETTVVKDENPPKLRFSLNMEGLDKNSLRCFVPGQSECLLTQEKGETGQENGEAGQEDGETGFYVAEALQPIAGRRSKYTLTASDMRGRSWYWFSQLWVLPRGAKVADQPVSR
jgi:peptidoglycan/xylan/chitin deacetylase (PgdA/CDA1 family)